jgi:hypothetical protein
MAAIAFFVIGSAVGSAVGGSFLGLSAAAVGGAVGGLFGSFIDSQFILPAIFGGKTSLTGPRVDDLSVQTASEGSPMRIPYGNHNRFAGTVIWTSDLIEVTSTDEQDVGGKGGSGGSVSQTTYNYYVDIAVAVCSGPIHAVTKIMADSKVIYEGGVKDHRSQSITVYTGTTAQTANSLMESYLGAGNVPAYRGTAYVVIERLWLADFGNRIPNLTFYVQAKSTAETVAGAVGNILERAGLSSSQYDTSGLGSTVLQGYTLVGPTKTLNALETLMMTFNFTAQERDGKIRFFYREDADQVVLAESDLAAKTTGGDPVPRLTLTDVAGYDIPSEVDVRYIDYDQGLQAGAQRARRVERVTDAVDQVEIPITLTAAEARQIAERRLWTAWKERLTFETTIPPSYFSLLESDEVSITFKNETYIGRITDVSRGANSLVVVKGVITDSATAVQSGPADPGAWVPPTLYIPPALTLIAITGPALVEEHINQPGYYYAVCATSPDAEWLGATVFDSQDDLNYFPDAAIVTEGKLGKALTVLSGTGAVPELWDRRNTVDVELYHGTISTATEEEVLAGANRMFLGGELIGYQTVTPIGTNQYRLSTLLRGVRDTGDKMGTHAINEDFWVLNPAAVIWSPENTGSINTTRYLKAVPTGLGVPDVSSETLLLDAGTCKGFSPGRFSGVRDFTTNDWTLSWLRRSRYFTKLYDSVPLEEGSELYDLEILDGSSNVVRTFSGISSLSQVYTSAQQVTDFGSNQSIIRARVYQITDLLGRGKPATGSF